MKHLSSILLAFVAPVMAGLASPQMLLQPEPSPPPATDWEIVWSTDPGIRYELLESTNMVSWTTVAGYPTEAEAMAQKHAFESNTIPERKYFKVRVMDEQPPSFTSRYPAPDSFAIPRFADLAITLEDATGINPASLALSLNGGAALTTGSPGVTFDNGVFTYDSGAVALGAWGSTVIVSMVAADLLGYTATNTWSFSLEPEAVTEANIYVFGSPPAQFAGQAVFGPAATLSVLAPASTWSIFSVTSNQVVIAYAPGSPPSFTVGQLICNQAPTTLEEIFYRRIDYLADDPGSSRLTLNTTEVPLTEFVSQGGVSFSGSSTVYALSGSALTGVAYAGGTHTFPTLTMDLSGSSFGLRHDGFMGNFKGLALSTGSPPEWLSATLTQQSFSFTPTVRAGVEIGGRRFKAVEVVAGGTLDIQCEVDGRVALAGVFGEARLVRLTGPSALIQVGAVGLVPIYCTVKLVAEVNATAEAAAALDFNQFYRNQFDAELGMSWKKDRGVDWIHHYTAGVPQTGGSAGLGVEFTFTLGFEPKLEFLVYGAAGFGMGVEIEGTAASRFPGPTAELGASVGLLLEPAGWLLDGLGVDEKLSLTLWEKTWPVASPQLTLASPPSDRIVNEGEAVSFTCAVTGPANPAFQWYHQGVIIPGASSNTLHIPKAGTGHQGAYVVRVTAGGQQVSSNPATLIVRAAGDVELADAFQYPIGSRIPIPEFPDGTANERNDLYPGNPSGNTGGRTGLSRPAGWYNYQDVGSFYSVLGGIHPGEDWNKVGGDTGEAVYPIAKGRIVQIAPTSGIGVNPSAWGWRVVVEHQLAASVRRSGDAASYYSVYAHITAHPGGAVNASAADFPRQVGASVGMDQPLGYIAAISAPHLHLELRRKVREIGAQTSLWPNTSGGYYSNAAGAFMSSMNAAQVAVAFNLMKAEGFVDPSDFIDDHQTNGSPAPLGFASIPGGTFTMGSPESELGRFTNETQHVVTLSAFHLQRTEVTWAQWNEVRDWAQTHGYPDLYAGANGSINWSTTLVEPGGAHPVSEVGWYDCAKWLNAWSEKEGLMPVYRWNGSVYRIGQPDWGQTAQITCNFNANGYRLPTEAEWEYACRAGTTTPFYNGPITQPEQGDSVDPVFNESGWYYNNSQDSTHPVGRKLANAWGLYDMHGNAWEWCWDIYDNYPVGAQVNPRGASSGSYRVVRGGSWSSYARYCRAAFRGGDDPGFSGDYGSSIGFRPARSAVP